jgi:hypothetical protein
MMDEFVFQTLQDLDDRRRALEKCDEDKGSREVGESLVGSVLADECYDVSVSRPGKFGEDLGDLLCEQMDTIGSRLARVELKLSSMHQDVFTTNRLADMSKFIIDSSWGSTCVQFFHEDKYRGDKTVYVVTNVSLRLHYAFDLSEGDLDSVKGSLRSLEVHDGDKTSFWRANDVSIPSGEISRYFRPNVLSRMPF